MDDHTDVEEEVTRMFKKTRGGFSSDQDLAFHLMHRFNIDRETLESMPAFEEHMKPLFAKEPKK
jgi:hypothetical protein